jgi:hypothetical protein
MFDGAGPGAEDADRLVANLPAVAIRTVQEIPPPPLANAGDLGQLVVDPGRGEDPPRLQCAAAGDADDERRVEPRLDRDHPVLDQLDAVAGHLDPARGQEVGRRHAVAGQESLHVSGRSVAWFAGVDHGDPAPRPAEHERRTQAGSAAADHHHVIAGCVHASEGARAAPDLAMFVAVSGNGVLA